MTQYFVGIDVGTGSARAGVFNVSGACLGAAKYDTELYNEVEGFVEQSGNNIWASVCHAVKAALAEAGKAPSDIAGIGFGATCSLVTIDEQGQPLAVGPTKDPERNIMVWMDHRAADQARRINATKHRVLENVGGVISPEMETPKLLWLKENIPDTFAKGKHFFDLTDFLTWKATDDLARSICTVTCKWTYMAHENSWDKSYFEEIGLAELCEDNFARIGSKIVNAGTALGNGLAQKAASEMGLIAGIPVAAGLIDAHAAGVGTVGAEAEGGSPETRMAYVFGTSACTMTSSRENTLVSGVWGPYYSAMVPGLWLNEGGQSAAGAAIEHLIKFHPGRDATDAAKAEAKKRGMSLPSYLVEKATPTNGELSSVVDLAGQIIVVPEFLGNRAPFADPEARGIISGLGLETGMESLVALYVAGICGLGYGLKQILNAQKEKGLNTDTVVISGGAGRSPLVRQLLADAAGIALVGPGNEEPVLLGVAMLGAVAGGTFDDLQGAMKAMSKLGRLFNPVSGKHKETHLKRFKVFEALQAGAKHVR